MKTISSIVNARLESTRLPCKMLQKIKDKTLLEIALDKMIQLEDVEYKYLAACDPEILEIYKKYEGKIELLKRSQESVQKGKLSQQITFAHYKDIPTDYIFWINACCPFVKVKTYNKAIEEFKNSFLNPKTMTSIIKRNNIFFDKFLCSINGDIGNVSTQNIDSVYEMAHVFHVFDKNYFVKNGTFWDYSPFNPALFIVEDRIEAMDIDDNLDLMTCQCLAEKRPELCK